MEKVILDLTHLEYILSQLPDKPESSTGEQVRSIIKKALTVAVEKNEVLEFEWFYDSSNGDLPLNEFIDLPMDTQMLHVSEFFDQFSDPVYVRVVTALIKRKCNYINQLLNLSIFQFGCTPNLGTRSHLAILRALQQASKSA